MTFIENNYKKIVLLIGLFFFSFLFYLSWIFFKERMLSFDSSFFSFVMINQKDFFLPHARWGGGLYQLLPVIALKYNCSLETFLRFYSISPIILYSIVFAIITLGLKNYRAGIALMLVLCLAFRHAFYYPVVELYLGLAITILFWALLYPENEYKSLLRKRVAFGFSLFLIYVMQSLHPLTLFSILFVIIAEFVANKRYKDFYLWGTFAFTIVWYIVRTYLLSGSEYENEQIVSLKVFFEQLPKLRYLPSTVYFKSFAPHELWSMFLLILISWVYLFRMKKWLYFIFLPGFSISFLVLILINYYLGESPNRYENYYTLLGVFAAVPIMFVAYKNISKKMILVFLIPILLINLSGLYNAHAILTKRVEYIDHLVSYGRKHDSKKYMLNNRNFPWQVAWVTWAVPFETTLYSALQHPDSAVTFFVAPEMNKYDSLIQQENIFLGPEWAISWFNCRGLNQNYFRFPSSKYEKLNTSQSDTTFHESEFNNKNIQIIPLKETYYSDADSFIVAPLLIKNLSNKTLYSTTDCANPTLLSYHIYDSEGKLVNHDGRRTILDIDIKDTYIQGLTITLPKKKDVYSVEVDFVTEGKRWWGINSKFKLMVK